MTDVMFLCAGLGLIILEVVIPGFFMLWLGIAALFTAGFCSTFGLSLQTALITFAVLAVIIMIFGYFAYESLRHNTPLHKLNKRAIALIGQEFVLSEAIKGGRGTVAIGDSIWLIRCEENLLEGTKVTVIGVDGNHLIVRKI